MRYIFCAILLSAICIVAPRAHAAPSILLNELMWMGSSVSTADEWIELRNPADQTVDISGWQLAKYSNGQDVPMLSIPANTSIPPHGYFVISNYAVGSHSALQQPPQLVTTDVALANSNLRIQLLDASGNVIDVAGDGKTTPLAGQYISAQKMYASMERNSDGGDGASAGSWHTATVSQGFLPGLSERGTPGAANSNGQPQINLPATFSGTAGVPIHLDASDTTDPENDPLTFSWNIAEKNLNGPTIDVTLPAGEYMGTVSVADGVNTSTQSFSIKVAASATSPSPAVLGTSTTSCKGIILDEVFPDPKGADTTEFLELMNMNASSTSLAGCHLLVNEARQYQLPVKELVAASRIVLDHQKWKLNNSGMTITLLDSDGTRLGTVTYPKAKEGKSWSLVGDEWGWANPSPNKKNSALLAVPEATGSNTSSAKKTSTPVSVQGIVVAQTGLIGAQLSVVQSSEDVVVVKTDTGIFLACGEQIHATGVAGTHLGTPIVILHGKVAGPIAAVGTGATMNLGDLDWPDQYRVVQVRGTVQAVKGTAIVIQDDSGDGQVSLKTASRIIRPALQSGDRLTVTGIVSIATTGIKILPRQASDLIVTPRPIATSATTVVAPTKNISTWWYWGAAGLGLSIVGFMQLRKKHESAA